MAESFVDTFKTELLADRVWRARAQLELAVVEYIGWSNYRPASLRDRLPHPVEYEAQRSPAGLKRRWLRPPPQQLKSQRWWAASSTSRFPINRRHTNEKNAKNSVAKPGSV
jgi:hypothetical protein